MGIPPQVKVVSAVGSGDAFLGAYLLALLRGKDTKEAFSWGLAAGSAAAMTPGTRLLKKEDFKSLLNEVVVKEV